MLLCNKFTTCQSNTQGHATWRGPVKGQQCNIIKYFSSIILNSFLNLSTKKYLHFHLLMIATVSILYFIGLAPWSQISPGWESSVVGEWRSQVSTVHC